MEKVAVKRVLDALVAVIGATLKKGGDIKIAGLGRFKVSSRKARTGRNPKTGEAVKIAASKKPTFRASSDLKALVD